MMDQFTHIYAGGLWHYCSPETLQHIYFTEYGGQDANPGTLDHPVATERRARQLVAASPYVGALCLHRENDPRSPCYATPDDETYALGAY